MRRIRESSPIHRNRKQATETAFVGPDGGPSEQRLQRSYYKYVQRSRGTIKKKERKRKKLKKT